MQQLTHQQITYSDGQIFIALTQTPEWSDFQVFCRLLQTKFDLYALAMEQGADRFQCQFRHQQQSFTLYYEQLCHSLWIESQENQASKSLYEHFLLHC